MGGGGRGGGAAPGTGRSSYTAVTASRLRSVKSPFSPMKRMRVVDAPKLEGKCMSRLWTPPNFATCQGPCTGRQLGGTCFHTSNL